MTYNGLFGGHLCVLGYLFRLGATSGATFVFMVSGRDGYHGNVSGIRYKVATQVIGILENCAWCLQDPGFTVTDPAPGLNIERPWRNGRLYRLPYWPITDRVDRIVNRKVIAGLPSPHNQN
jgi:hypothetical protein